MDYSNVLNSGVEVELKNITLKLSEATLGDIQDFSEYLRNEKKKELINCYKETGQNLDIKELMNVKITEKEMGEAQLSISGIIFLIHSIAKRFNPNITIEELKNKLVLNDLPMILSTIFKMEEKKENFQEPVAQQ